MRHNATMYDTEWERLHNVGVDCRHPHHGLQASASWIADIPVAVAYARQPHLHRSGKFSIFALPCMKSGKDITSSSLFSPFTHKKKSEKEKERKGKRRDKKKKIKKARRKR